LFTGTTSNPISTRYLPPALHLSVHQPCKTRAESLQQSARLFKASRARGSSACSLPLFLFHSPSTLSLSSSYVCFRLSPSICHSIRVSRHILTGTQTAGHTQPTAPLPPAACSF